MLIWPTLLYSILHLRKYVNIKTRLDDDVDGCNLALQNELEFVEKKLQIVENQESYESFLRNRRETKEKNREFDIKRGCEIERQACFVWKGGSYKKLQQFLDEGKKMVPFDGRSEFI